MDDDNPYAPPRAEVANPVDNGPSSVELADRGIRLLGAIIDNILLLLVYVPAMMFGGFFEAAIKNPNDMMLGLVWGLIGFGLFVLMQAFPLYYWGQTWAKRLLDIRIIDQDGHQPEFWRLIVLRYGVPTAFGMIPYVGAVFSLVNALFIFGDDRRCLHDLVAGTRVINIHKR